MFFARTQTVFDKFFDHKRRSGCGLNAGSIQDGGLFTALLCSLQCRCSAEPAKPAQVGVACAKHPPRWPGRLE